MNNSQWRALGLVPVCALGLAACSVLEPGEAGLSPDEEITVTSSEMPDFEPEDVPDKEVKDDLTQTVKDEGLGVEWTLQGVYADSVQGSVVTVALKNLNDVPLPADAIGQPKLEYRSGSSFEEVDLLDYDPEVNSDVNPPGLDYPLGEKATTNVQYRVDASPTALTDARLTLGNVTWVGNLNL